MACALTLLLSILGIFAGVEIDYPPKDRELVVGAPASFGVIPRGFDAKFQWYKDGVALQSATNDQIVLERTSESDAGVYSVVVSNNEGVVTNSARLLVRARRPGDADFSFQPTLSAEANEAFQVAVRQADGKFVLVGSFDEVNEDVQGRIARVNPDGSTDRTFEASVGGRLDWLTAASLQADGKLLIAGSFHSINDEPWPVGIARLNRDGSLDRNFRIPTLLRNNVGPFMPLSDGKVMVFGSGLYRLNTNGSIDPTFSFSWPPEQNPPSIAGLAFQPDGRIVLGFFGERRTNAARLKPNGEIDKTFVLPISLISPLEALPIGKVLIAGEPKMITMNEDGTFEDFGPPLLLKYPYVTTKRLKSGRIAVSGIVPSVPNGSTMVLLNPDGTVDDHFRFTGEFPQILFADEEDQLFVTYGQWNHRSYAWLDHAGNVTRTVQFNVRTRQFYDFHPTGFQSEGKMLMTDAGWKVQRLNPDGTVDNSFHREQGGPEDRSAYIQTDDKVLIGHDVPAEISPPWVLTNASVIRLNRDGDWDKTFQAPPFTVSGWRSGFVSSFQTQRDGKILVGGLFSTIGDSTRNNIARLNADGTLDETFAPGGGLGGILPGDHEYPPRPYVGSMLLQDDGKIIVTGLFILANGIPRNDFARFNSDGSLDLGFEPPRDLTNIAALAIQSDGRLVVAAPSLMRLNGDGTVDSSFRNGAVTSIEQVRTILVLPKGQIMIGGGFQTIDGVNRPFLARLDADGWLEEDFLAGLSGPDAPVSSVLMGPEGNLTIGGEFMRVNGYGRPSLARIFRDGSVVRIKSVHFEKGTLAMEWRSEIGNTYQVEQKTNLNQSSWLEVGSSVTAHSESTQSTVVAVKNAYFRVKRVR